jgi:hypothetical protein
MATPEQWRRKVSDGGPRIADPARIAEDHGGGHDSLPLARQPPDPAVSTHASVNATLVQISAPRPGGKACAKRHRTPAKLRQIGHTFRQLVRRMREVLEDCDFQSYSFGRNY